MQWCCEGSGTYGKRRELFERQRRVVEKQLRQMEKNPVHDPVQSWYLEQALQDGSEERVTRMMPDHLPAEIQKLYDECSGREPGRLGAPAHSAVCHWMNCRDSSRGTPAAAGVPLSDWRPSSGHHV